MATYRPAFPLAITVLALCLCVGCAVIPPGEKTPVADLIPEWPLRIEAGQAFDSTVEFEVAQSGYGWLYVHNPDRARLALSLNSRGVKVGGDKPRRVRLQAGNNRLTVSARADRDAGIAIRLTAVADDVHITPIVDASENAIAPVRADVRVSALGRPVANAEVALFLLGERGRIPDLRRLPDPGPAEALLTGEIDIGKPESARSGVLTRRLVVTDRAGKASVALPGLQQGSARLLAGIGDLRLESLGTIFVPPIRLRPIRPSYQLPIDTRRVLPLELGVFGVSDHNRTVDLRYAVRPQRRDGLTVRGPTRLRFDRSTNFPLNVNLAARRPGKFTLTITARDSMSGRSESVRIPVTVVERDETTALSVHAPIAKPAGVAPGSGEQRIRFEARVSGGAARPRLLRLDEVDPDGKVLAAGIASLLDNGQGQDRYGDDRVYTGTATIDSAREGARYFRVSADDRGITAASAPRTFLVTRFPIDTPPPDPDRFIEFDQDGTRIVANQVILVLDPALAADGERIEQLAATVDGRIVDVVPPIRAFLLEFDGARTADAVLDAIRRLSKLQGVEAADPNFEVSNSDAPGEACPPPGPCCMAEMATCQWYVEHVDADKAWRKAGGGSSSQAIALFESEGVTGTHSDLNATGMCNPGNGVTPCNAGGHGTRVAGIMAADGNDGGIAGLAWQTPYYVYSNSGDSLLLAESISESSAAEVILNVSQASAAVPALQTAVSDALTAGKLLVASAGNVGKTGGVCNPDVNKYPAKYNTMPSIAGGILAVGATDYAKALGDWGALCSNRGAWVEIFAPGKNIYTTQHPAGHSHASGTSLATPIVSGAAAMLWALNPKDTGGWDGGDIHNKILGRSADLTGNATGVTGFVWTGEKEINVYDMLGVPVLSLSDDNSTINSDCSDGSSFTVASAADPDIIDPIIPWDLTDQLTYTFVDGAGNSVATSGPFELNSTTGEVSVQAASCPLSTAASPHDLTVRVTDSIGMTDELSLTVNVQSVVSNFSGTIDFESPSMPAGEDRRGLDPYTIPSGEVSFVVNDDFGFPDAIVGLTRNSATSACFEPSNAGQRLGTGRDVSGTTDFIGLSGFQVRAVFTPALQPNAGEQVRISAQLQALTGTQIRIRLFDAADNEVGLAQSTLTLDEGTCNFPGGSRAHDTITAATTSAVAYAVFDVPTNSPSGGRVFAIDNVDISVSP